MDESIYRKNKISYIYDCLEYTFLKSSLEIHMRNPFLFIKKDTDWISYVDTNKCISEYVNNKKLMGEDIHTNGMYMPFFYTYVYCKNKEENFKILRGFHRVDGLCEYYKENPSKEKMHPFFIHKECEHSNHTHYIVPKNIEFYFHYVKFDEYKDLYVDSMINKKYVVRELDYNMCLIKYDRNSIAPVLLSADSLAPLIWDWNNSVGEELNIKSKRTFNDFMYFINNKDNVLNKLQNKLIGDK